MKIRIVGYSVIKDKRVIEGISECKLSFGLNGYINRNISQTLKDQLERCDVIEIHKIPEE